MDLRVLMKKLLKNKKLVVALPVIVILVIIYFLTIGKKDNTPQYQTTPATKSNIISTVSASGQALTSHTNNVTSSATGTVKAVYIKDDDQVKTGQKIMEISLDSAGLQAQSQAYTSYLSAKNGLASAQTNLYSLNSAMFAANQKFINDAVARGLTVDDPTYIQQYSDWKSAEEKYLNQKNSISQSQSAVNNAWLSYKLTQSVVTAPSGGIITGITVAPGMQLTESSTRLAAVVSPGNPLIVLDISEIDVLSIQTDQKVIITFDSIADLTFTGKVVNIDRLGSITSGVTNYSAIIELDTNPDQVLPNMAASGNIIIDSKTDVLTVPLTAVKTQSGQNYVTVLKDNNPQNMPVEVGISSDTLTEIISGINEGDLVVTGQTSSVTTNGTSQSGSLFPATGGGGGTFRMLH